MIKQLKEFTVRMLVGANVVTIALMLCVGYSDRLDPEHFPLLGGVGIAFPLFVAVNLVFFCLWLIFHWRKTWIPAVGFLLAYVPINIYMPVRAKSEPPDGCLKIISYNVHGFSGLTWGHNIFDSIYNYVKAEQPDILCLQEDNDTWRKADERWAEFLDYNELVCVSLEGVKFKNHVGVHTRLPIVKTERIEVETKTKVNGAGAFYLDLGKGDTLLVVVCHLENIHLDSSDRKQYKEMLKGNVGRDTVREESVLLYEKLCGAIPIRAKQVKAIKRYIATHRGGHPLIVCGDFNDTPISYTHHALCEGLADCFVESGRGLGLSYNQKGFNSRIDYILCSPELTPYGCYVDRKMAESDHYPVVCSLKIGDKP